MQARGKVYLVGAGPGDAELISLRGVRILQRADEVLYDYLVNPAILEHVPTTAECVCLGSHSNGSIWKPEQIQDRMVQTAQQGKQVVRLKSGDPIVFGRAGAELRRLAAAGIEFEVVPGITAGLAAACYAGLPVTDREVASAVALVTGQESSAKLGPSLDYHALARFPGTLVVYMGVTTAERWTSQLIAEGKSPDCPVALIRRSTWPDQRMILCRLADVTRYVTPYSKFPPPVVAIVGPIANRASTWNWYEQRPLFGTRVVVARPRHQATQSAGALRELGADVIVQPAIEVTEPEDWGDADRLIDRLSEFQTVAFTSSNGVRGFCDRLFAKGDLRQLAHLRLAAVGPSTMAALEGYHLRADVVPRNDYRADALVAELEPDADGQRFLLVRGDRGRDTLARGLRAAGGVVEELVAYVTRDVETLDAGVAERLRAASEVWVTATSPSIARSIQRLIGDLAPIRWASISPLTSAAIRDMHQQIACEAERSTMDGLIDAIQTAVIAGK